MTRYKPMSDGEYHLMIEEYIRACTPINLGYAMEKQSGQEKPAIVTTNPLENKENLKFRSVDCSWAAAQFRGRLDAVFLNITFKQQPGKAPITLKVCINQFKPLVIDWFKRLIYTNGEMILNDSSGHVEAIRIMNVPLDIPKTIVNLAQRNPIKIHSER